LLSGTGTGPLSESLLHTAIPYRSLSAQKFADRVATKGTHYTSCYIKISATGIPYAVTINLPAQASMGIDPPVFILNMKKVFLQGENCL
jgi:hypothetical protein